MSDEPNLDVPDFESDELPDLEGILRQPDDAIDFGRRAALREEIEKADAILANAPSKVKPIDVMRYLETLRDINRDGELYSAGWRTRWNPVIVRFFAATNFGKPEGDTTSWCAASLNWCLKHSGFRFGTNSAASASFRSAPGKTQEPIPGDIVVFVQTADASHGHVTLFLAEHSGRIQCLGGNQTDKSGHHAICTKWIPKRGFLTFHSYHSIDALR
jgi:uncharacterized protein (TIGR02594 family)